MAHSALVLTVLAIACGTAVAGQAQDAGHAIEIEGDAVRLSDFTAVPVSVDDPVVARFPAGEHRLTFSAEVVTAILRRRAPGLSLTPRVTGDLLFVRSPQVRADRAAGCSRLNQPVARGTFITAQMVSPAACVDGERAALAFDRDTRSLVAADDLSAGAWLGRVSLTERPMPLPSAAPLRLQVRSGPVVIEREVRTLQPARPGDRVFVMTSDGEVMAAQLASDTIERTGQ